MNFENEKDYIMRIIHEVLKLVIRILRGKYANQEEQAPVEKYSR